MKFQDITDENGTSLNSYAELLAEKAKTAGLVSILVFASKEKNMIHAISTLDGSPANALIQLGRSMLANEPTKREGMEPVSPNNVN